MNAKKFLPLKFFGQSAKNYICVALCAISLFFIQCAESDNIDKVKINQIQVLGTHNSYAKPVDPRILHYGDSVITGMMTHYMSMIPAGKLAEFKEYHPNGMSMAEGLHYEHPPFDVQLDAGIRSLEIDVYHDPNGSLFSQPAGQTFFEKAGITDLASFSNKDLDQPGFKVLHIPDFDFRTHYTTFKDALLAVKTWSDKNKNHVPLFLMIEAKGSAMPVFPNPTAVLPLDAAAFDALDQEIVSVIGRDKIITPDDIRSSYPTLNAAVKAQNWPLVHDARGKFVFLLLPSTGGLGGEISPYIENRPNLEGRMMFMQSKPTDTYGAFLLLDNAIVRQDDIQRYVKEGYLVRTRSDIETYEAKVNDLSRAQAAFASGAQIISTDFFQDKNTYNNTYKVALPNGKEIQLNPINN